MSRRKYERAMRGDLFMSLEDIAETNLRKAVNTVLHIPRPLERKRILADVFNELIAIGEIKLLEKP